MSLYESYSKQWKERPPGPEQLLLESMFEEGEIDQYATAESVQNMRSEFKEFTSRVFATHFRKTKAIFGGFASNKSSQQVDNDVFISKKAKGTGGTGLISELGSLIASKSSTSKLHTSKPTMCKPSGDESSVAILNPPYSVWTYTDHQKKIDFVCVVIAVFTGKTNMTFELDDNGMKITVKFTWPESIFDAKKLFKSAVDSGQMTMYHPKVHAFESTLLDRGITDSSSPEMEWVISLPCKVRREVESYSSERIQCESTRILFLQFTAFQKDVIIQNADRSILFDD